MPTQETANDVPAVQFDQRGIAEEQRIEVHLLLFITRKYTIINANLKLINAKMMWLLILTLNWYHPGMFVLLPEFVQYGSNQFFPRGSVIFSYNARSS